MYCMKKWRLSTVSWCLKQYYYIVTGLPQYRYKKSNSVHYYIDILYLDNYITLLLFCVSVLVSSALQHDSFLLVIGMLFAVELCSSQLYSLAFLKDAAGRWKKRYSGRTPERSEPSSTRVPSLSFIDFWCVCSRPNRERFQFPLNFMSHAVIYSSLGDAGVGLVAFTIGRQIDALLRFRVRRGERFTMSRRITWLSASGLAN